MFLCFDGFGREELLQAGEVFGLGAGKEDKWLLGREWAIRCAAL